MTLSYTCVDVSLHGRQLRASPSAHIGSIASVQARVVALRRIELKTPLRPQSGVGVARPIWQSFLPCTLDRLYKDLVFAPPALPIGVITPIGGGGGAAFRVRSVLLNASNCNLVLLHPDGLCYCGTPS